MLLAQAVAVQIIATMALTGRERRSQVLMTQDGILSNLLPALRFNDRLCENPEFWHFYRRKLLFPIEGHFRKIEFSHSLTTC